HTNFDNTFYFCFFLVLSSLLRWRGVVCVRSP
ncbi:hypothetical protein Pcinc_038789, partial [Petrolisthes cinctipes]